LKNRSEQGEQAVTGEAFYLLINAPPEFLVCARLVESAESQTTAACRRSHN
jgi:hypothetical protein